MEYTVLKLARLAGVSTRTLRYYDEIEILKPARMNSSGYRIYGEKEVNLLQQIMLYREMGVDLDTIKEIITRASFDETAALKEHLNKLLTQRQQLDKLIVNVEKTIEYKEGRIKLSDSEKFDGFKQKLIEENENKYGKEIREKYGDEKVNQSNQKLMNMTEEQYEEFKALEKEILDTLEEAYHTGDPAGELAQRAAKLHHRWISFTWSSYSREAHAGLAKLYVEDERFQSYYDQKQPGLAKFLSDAILIYTGMN